MNTTLLLLLIATLYCVAGQHDGHSSEDDNQNLEEKHSPEYTIVHPETEVEPEHDNQEHEEHENDATHWEYKGTHGPDSWGSSYPDCNDRRQSPIDIHTHSAITTSFPPLALTYYFSKPDRITLKNNGHTAQLEVEMALGPEMTGGAYLSKYQFAQLHFHWGGDSSKGSEHTIDGKSYPLEMHLVHYNKNYPNIQDVVDNKYPDGLGVLGVFFQKSKSDNPVLNNLLEALERIPEAGNVTEIKKLFSIGSLLPQDLNKFYVYSGSLTTPGCYEIVTWTVITDPVPISNSQLNRFRALRGNRRGRLIDNYRPSQAHVGRNVFYRAASAEITSSICTIILTILVAIMLR